TQRTQVPQTQGREEEAQGVSVFRPEPPPQAAYRALSDEAARDYEAVKEAILDVLDITPETFRRRFRGTPYNLGVRPRALAQELKEACRRWLRPEQHSKEDLLDTIVLEQFLHVLPELLTDQGTAFTS
uniref:SCAN box domain-containing protein n=1 Tax=Pelusios castaneus TaxID=367368 RepID=A0A8C8RXM7_9SAUR